MADRLTQGVSLEDGVASAVDAQVIKRNPSSTWIELTGVEGRNRLLRRMVEKLGFQVIRLRRVAYAGLELGDLKPGSFRALNGGEKRRLKRWASGHKTTKTEKHRSKNG